MSAPLRALPTGSLHTALLPRCSQDGRSALSRRGGEHSPELRHRAVEVLRTHAERHAWPPIEVDLPGIAAACRTWPGISAQHSPAWLGTRAPARRASY